MNVMASESLYGIPRPKRTQGKEISSSSNLAFTSNLSSLLTAQPTTSAARARPSKTKGSIFSTHNKNIKKRAAADISEDGKSSIVQNHSTHSAAVDSATLHRSKRKLEEKARIYASMKRGEYVPPANSERAEKRDSNLLVDFDRKWAEDIEAGRTSDTSESENEDEADNEMLTYEDEFGRERHGTRAEANREIRRRNAQKYAAEELASFSARPVAPSRIIYGDIVQSAAYNPDAKVSELMENIARKRDRSMTPPEDVHYDASKEVRSKGVGFYSFSKDSEGRKREMSELKKEREGTEREKKEREEREERERKKERKREEELQNEMKAEAERKGQLLAEEFLDGLDGD